jgi:hypothetical protein
MEGGHASERVPVDVMWNLTSFDINRIKGQLQARRARIDAKYAEETKALEADFAELDTLERVATAIALKYKADEPADTAEQHSADTVEHNPPSEAAMAPEALSGSPAGDVNGPEAKAGSRWRLALRERPAVSEAEQQTSVRI